MEVTCNIQTEEFFQVNRGNVPPGNVKFLAVMLYNKSFADVQVAPGKSLRQSSKPVLLEKLGGEKATLK